MTKNLFDLSGKVALITGGNSGIGLGFAEGVAKQGADVCIWGRNTEKNAEAVKVLRKYGTEIHAMQCDVAREAEVEQSFAQTLEVFGRVDSCFANSGVARAGRFEDFSMEDWRHVMDINLDGLFYNLALRGKAHEATC
jgi:NAD(P)-dependent dehydrogenase (short-subunit alcohol dehydrogenase family)